MNPKAYFKKLFEALSLINSSDDNHTWSCIETMIEENMKNYGVKQYTATSFPNSSLVAVFAPKKKNFANDNNCNIYLTYRDEVYGI